MHYNSAAPSRTLFQTNGQFLPRVRYRNFPDNPSSPTFWGKHLVSSGPTLSNELFWQTSGRQYPGDYQSVYTTPWNYCYRSGWPISPNDFQSSNTVSAPMGTSQRLVRPQTGTMSTWPRPRVSNFLSGWMSFWSQHFRASLFATLK